MEAELASALAQFGAAGLIAWMWLTERRSLAERERQLTEVHHRLEQERPHFTTLITVVQDNTRALTAIEAGQRTLAALVERSDRRHPSEPHPTPAASPHHLARDR